MGPEAVTKNTNSEARPGMAWRGEAWRGGARRGEARHGGAWLGRAWQGLLDYFTHKGDWQK